MMSIHLVGQLLAGKLHLLGINNDDMISGIKKRSVDRLVLAGKKSRGPGGQSPEDLPFSINNMPLLLNIPLTGDKTLHHSLPHLTTKQNNPLGYPRVTDVSRGIAVSGTAFHAFM